MRVGFSRPFIRTLLLALCALGVPGCYFPGGPLWSADRFTYESSTWQPWTVTLVDTRTGEATWSVDVPVGEQVVLSFSKGTGPNEYKPDEIVWELMPAGRRFGARNNRLPCPPAGARRLDATLRPTPETPEQAFTEPRKLHNQGGRTMQPINPPSVGANPPATTSSPSTTTTPPATTTPGSGPAVLPPPRTNPTPPPPAPEPAPATEPAPTEEPPSGEPEPTGPIDIPE